MSKLEKILSDYTSGKTTSVFTMLGGEENETLKLENLRVTKESLKKLVKKLKRIIWIETTTPLFILIVSIVLCIIFKWESSAVTIILAGSGASLMWIVDKFTDAKRDRANAQFLLDVMEGTDNASADLIINIMTSTLQKIKKNK
jgi:hypothetical protein